MNISDGAFLQRFGIQIDFEKFYRNGVEDITKQLQDEIRDIAAEQEKNSNLYKTLGEDGISANFVSALNRTFLFKAHAQSNSRGHVDITVVCPSFSEHQFEYLGEAKIWRGPKYCIDGFDQLNGYVTGRLPRAFMILYFRSTECDVPFEEYVNQLVTDKGGKLICRESRFIVTEHQHKSTAKIFIDHYAVHMPE